MITTTDKGYKQDLNKDLINGEFEAAKSDSHIEDEISEHLSNIDGGSIQIHDPINDNFPGELDNGFATTNDNSRSPYYSLGDGGD
ncbi:hypothetical protein H1Q59_01480 [Holosporaceae bacterium 'Namur']|nr:hypothetical protein [Holosporaceae bacterium 'Namur']